MTKTLSRVSRHITPPNTVIDVGAAVGDWTRIAAPIFPHAHFLLVDPLIEREMPLTELKEELPDQDIEFIIAAAGDHASRADFGISADLDGSGFFANTEQMRTVDIIPLDDIIRNHSLTGPFILKTDTHGFEQQILNGASKLLEDTQAVIMECYNFDIAPTSQMFWQMCAHMDSLGFRVADLADPWPRKYDELLWQMDLVWLPCDNRVFQYNEYQ